MADTNTTIYPINYTDSETGYSALSVDEATAKELRKILRVGTKPADEAYTLAGAGDYEVTGEMLQYNNLHVEGNRIVPAAIVTTTDPHAEIETTTYVDQQGIRTYTVVPKVKVDVDFNSFVSKEATTIILDPASMPSATEIKATVFVNDKAGSSAHIEKSSTVDALPFVNNFLVADDGIKRIFPQGITEVSDLRLIENYRDAVVTKSELPATGITIEATASSVTRCTIDPVLTFKLKDYTGEAFSEAYTIAGENIDLKAALHTLGYKIVPETE